MDPKGGSSRSHDTGYPRLLHLDLGISRSLKIEPPCPEGRIPYTILYRLIAFGSSHVDHIPALGHPGITGRSRFQR